MKVHENHSQPASAGRHAIDMLNGPIWKKLLVFALPLIAMNILQQLFNSADLAVVGSFAGSKALAAVGTNGPVVALFVTLFSGMAIGANVVIANHIGSGRHSRVNEIVHTVMLLAFISAAAVPVIGFFIARPVLTAIGAPGDSLELAILYLRIYFIALAFQIIYNYGAAILRSKGDTRRPLVILTASGLINVALNMIFVVCFSMSVEGVALATVIANGFAAFMIILLLMREDGILRFYPSRLRFCREHLLKVIAIGAPAALQGAVFSFSNILVQSGINSFGADATAGSAAGHIFEIFSWYIVNGLGQAALTFISQNYGAGKEDRCRRIFWIALAEAVLMAGAFSFVLFLAERPLLSLFTAEPAVAAYAMDRMNRVMAFEFMTALYEIPGAALRGRGHSLLPALLTVIGTVGFRIFWLTVVLNIRHEYPLLMQAYRLSWILTGGMMFIAYFVILKKTPKSSTGPSAAASSQ